MEFFAEEIDSGSKCDDGHPIWLVAEGYGLCVLESLGWWWAWRMAPPLVRSVETRSPDWTGGDTWWPYAIRMRNGELENRWCEGSWGSKDQALAFIQRDMEAHRNLPFDEEAERSRLIAV